ncbi:MAG: hypothetical protein ACJAWV_003040, partial [Flammeovirgaceae bacterium]
AKNQPEQEALFFLIRTASIASVAILLLAILLYKPFYSYRMSNFWSPKSSNPTTEMGSLSGKSIRFDFDGKGSFPYNNAATNDKFAWHLEYDGIFDTKLVIKAKGEGYANQEGVFDYGFYVENNVECLFISNGSGRTDYRKTFYDLPIFTTP